MNKLAEFLHEHPHCTKFAYTTCGGILGFNVDLNQWLVQETDDLFGLICDMEPNVLKDIKDWPVFLKEIYKRCGNKQQNEIGVLQYWREHLGEDIHYDLFAIQHNGGEIFNPESDGAWLPKLVNEVINRPDENNIDSRNCPQKRRGIIEDLGICCVRAYTNYDKRHITSKRDIRAKMSTRRRANEPAV